MDMVACATCGTLFVPRMSGGKPQVRCSAKCRRKTANAGYIKRHAPQRTAACMECGGPVAQAERGRPRKFCSDECKKRLHNRAQNRRRLPVTQDAVRLCVHCGTAFVPNRRDRVYCFGFCAQAAYQVRKAAGEPLRQVEQAKVCVECGKDFTAQHPSAKWCSKACRIRTNAREASRRRGAVSGAVSYADRDIFDRDGWRCYLCGGLVDRHAPRTHPKGATIDHVVPLSLGGTDTPDNVATAHGHCNNEKRAKVALASSTGDDHGC